MDPGVWNQVGLELSHINIQGSIKPQRGSQGRDHLNQKTHQSPRQYHQYIYIYIKAKTSCGSV